MFFLFVLFLIHILVSAAHANLIQERLSSVFTIFGETASGLYKYGHLDYDSLILITIVFVILVRAAHAN